MRSHMLNRIAVNIILVSWVLISLQTMPPVRCKANICILSAGRVCYAEGAPKIGYKEVIGFSF